jgi:hypothetical protein
MVRLILIATAVFLALYLLSRRLNASQKSNEAKGDVVGPRSGGFLITFIAAVAILSVIFIFSRLGVSLGGLLQKALAFFPVIRALLPF